MTVNEIIKALECCRTVSFLDCRNCPYKGKKDTTALYGVCCNMLMSDTIDIINRQKAEIDLLTKECDDIWEERQNRCEADTAEAIKEFAERLKKKYVFHVVCDWRTLNGEIDNLVKEFTEEQT